jgi:hypothetical protein
MLRDHLGEVPSDVGEARLIAEVEYPPANGTGMRHAAFKGLRPDITP